MLKKMSITRGSGDKEIIKKWTREVLQEMQDWVSSIEDQHDHLLVVDLEFIDVHAYRLAAQLHWAGQVVARLREEEENSQADLDYSEGVILKGLDPKMSATVAKGTVKSDDNYMSQLKVLIAVRAQRRCAEALLEAIKTKESIMPGQQGAANSIRRTSGY